jgi:hypothetical protein
MKRQRSLNGLLFGGVLLVATASLAQTSYKLEPTPLPASADLPAALAAILQSQGSRVLDSTGAPLCEIWLAKAVPLKASPGSSADVIYGNLEVGTLVGAVHFPNKGSDYRGQAIKPGYYTLRYALVPQDGNHMGVNPTRDFLLMSPVTQDSQVDQVLQLDALLKLSRQASGTNHPAILTLSNASGGASPSLAQDEQGHWILQAQAKGKGAPLSLAIVVVGQAAAE